VFETRLQTADLFDWHDEMQNLHQRALGQPSAMVDCSRRQKWGAMSTSRTGGPPTKPVSDDEIRSLLDRYRCPMPFHVVRTRFLGNIASPDMTASPMDTVAGLWGGELPAIDNPDALNELLRVVLMGLWNRLAEHQNRNAPFRMIRVDVPETREGLANIAAIRREEVIGFIEGMFGKEQGLALPERARRALEALAEAGGLLRGVFEVACDPTKPASADDIAQTRRHISELTEICEREIHAALLSCTRARRRMPNSASTTRPSLH